MSPEDLLALSAEISVAILGFAAIASVLRGSQGSLSPDGRFWGMLALAFGGLVFSLAPLPFLADDVNQSVIWGISSSLLSVFMLLLWILTIVLVKGANQRAMVPTNYSVMILFISLMASTSLLAFYNSGLFITPRFSLYYGSVVSIHVITAAVFIRILTVWLNQ